MNEITLAEFLDQANLWGRIQALSPYPFFDTMPPDELDLKLILDYGERIVYPKIVSLDLDKLASLVNNTFSSKWEKLITINAIDFVNGAERVVNETVNNNVINTGSNNIDHKVSAFNTDVLITDNADHTASTNTTDGENIRLLTEKTTSLNTAYNNLLLSQKVNIIVIVLKDVSTFLTLDIYK